MGLIHWLFGTIPAAKDWGEKEAPNKRCLKPLKKCDDAAQETDEERYEKMDEDIEKLRNTRRKIKRYNARKSISAPPPIAVE